MTSPKKSLEVDKESTLFGDLSHIEVNSYLSIETNDKTIFTASIRYLELEKGSKIAADNRKRVKRSRIIVQNKGT